MRLEEIRRQPLGLRPGTQRRLTPQQVKQREQRVDITRDDLVKLEELLDKMFKEIGIDVVLTTHHFLERINTLRGDGPIFLNDIKDIFQKAYRKYGQFLAKQSPGFTATLQDAQTHMNVPFVIDFDRNKNELVMVAKTAMKTRNFRTGGRTMRVY